jgi:tetratricopeptide (TPR) repeat protein
MKNWWFLSWLILSMTSCASTAQRQKADHLGEKIPSKALYQRYLRQAESGLRLGRPEMAMRAARKAIEVNHAGSQAHGLLGRVLAMQGRLEDSSQSYKKALDLDPGNRQIIVELASVYDILKAYDLAASLYESFLREHPEDTEFRHQLGLTYLLQNRYDQGVKALSQALREQPKSVGIATDLGYAFWQKGQLNKAKDTFQKAITLKPDAAPPTRFLAKIYVAQKRYSQALKVLDAFLKIKPRQLGIRELRAKLNYHLGKHEAVWEDVSFGYGSRTKQSHLLPMGVGSLIHLQRFPEAKKFLQVCESLLGRTPEVFFRQLQLKLRQGDGSAFDELKRLAKENPDAKEMQRELSIATKRFR